MVAAQVNPSGRSSAFLFILIVLGAVNTARPVFANVPGVPEFVAIRALDRMRYAMLAFGVELVVSDLSWCLG